MRAHMQSTCVTAQAAVLAAEMTPSQTQRCAWASRPAVAAARMQQRCRTRMACMRGQPRAISWRRAPGSVRTVSRSSTRTGSGAAASLEQLRVFGESRQDVVIGRSTYCYMYLDRHRHCCRLSRSLHLSFLWPGAMKGSTTACGCCCTALYSTHLSLPCSEIPLKLFLSVVCGSGEIHTWASGRPYTGIFLK